MKFNSCLTFKTATVAVLLIVASRSTVVNAQHNKLEFGIHTTPLLCWFNSYSSDISDKRAKGGFNFGLTFNNYFYGNYAFSTGVSLITAGGSFSYSDDIMFNLNKPATALAGNRLMYNIKYLSIPVGIKLRTKQVGYISLFTNIGLDPKYAIGGNIEIPSQSMSKQNAYNELNKLSIGYHVIGGMEYSLGGSTAIEIGINFDSNFTNITKQPTDKILHKMLGLHLGLNF